MKTSLKKYTWLCMLNKQAYMTHVKQQTKVLFQISMQGKQENRTTNNTRNFLFYFILLPEAPSFRPFMSSLTIAKAQNTDLLTFPAITISQAADIKRYSAEYTYIACTKVHGTKHKTFRNLKHSTFNYTINSNSGAKKLLCREFYEISVISMFTI
jgi:hypothetical protein